MESVKAAPDNASYLDRKNLTFINRKMGGISTETTTPMECNNNLYPVDVINETNSTIRKQQKITRESDKNQNNKGIHY